MREPSRDPQRVTPEFWYYEDERKFVFVHEIREANGAHVRTDQIAVPTAMLRRSIRRCPATRKTGKVGA